LTARAPGRRGAGARGPERAPLTSAQTMPRAHTYRAQASRRVAAGAVIFVYAQQRAPPSSVHAWRPSRRQQRRPLLPHRQRRLERGVRFRAQRRARVRQGISSLRRALSTQPGASQQRVPSVCAAGEVQRQQRASAAAALVVLVEPYEARPQLSSIFAPSAAAVPSAVHPAAGCSWALFARLPMQLALCFWERDGGVYDHGGWWIAAATFDAAVQLPAASKVRIVRGASGWGNSCTGARQAAGRSRRRRRRSRGSIW
jgi:hypothetical protein